MLSASMSKVMATAQRCPSGQGMGLTISRGLWSTTRSLLPSASGNARAPAEGGHGGAAVVDAVELLAERRCGRGVDVLEQSQAHGAGAAAHVPDHVEQA